MSWIFGYIGNSHQLIIDPPETPIYQFKNSNLILFAGGNKQTCFFRSESSNSFWTVAGVGLKSTGGGYKILDENDWASHLFPNQNIKTVNGHFVALLYSESELKIFTDDLGLREIYIVKLSDGYGFTTRIEWLKFFIKPEIDLKEFGTRWLLQNQISRKSIIKNVIRLVGANATIKHNSLSVEQNFWRPNFGISSNREEFDLTLKKLLSIQDKRISLSLSGGLDSRLLLSYLSIKNSDLWDTHTFGDPIHPDSKTASELLKSLDRENEVIDSVLPSGDELIDLVKRYSVQSIVTNPISSILNLRFYNRLSDENRVTIDGGFGEIWRRTFANRLLLLGRNALMSKDASAVAKFLRFNRADIFSDEALYEMEKGIVDQLDILFEEMPDASQIGPAKWIDLFSIRSRLINYYAPEQARVDNYVVSFMPLVQYEILGLLFGLSDSEKNNGKLFKQLIRKNSIQLTKLPLVKGIIVHPFGSSALASRLHSRIKTKLGLSYRNEQSVKLLNSLKEFIRDTIQSDEVRNFEYYDREKLERIFNRFSSESNNYNSEMDWFLSFELFRQGISK